MVQKEGRWCWPKGVVSWCPMQGFPPAPQQPPGNAEVMFDNTAAHLVSESGFCITLGTRSESARSRSSCPF